MKTVAILIGNSDNRLTQRRWSEFVRSVHVTVNSFSDEIHFDGASPSDSPYQNHCWVFQAELSAAEQENFKRAISANAALFQQDSIAVVIGETKFVP